MADEEIPPKVREKLFAFRDANWAARAGYARQREAARHGDEESVALLEKGRPDRMLAVDRTRVELDEAIRRWE
jgi:hypothetical protein